MLTILIIYVLQAERLNISFVNPKSGVGLLSSDEARKVKETQNKNRDLLKIPRRFVYEQYLKYFPTVFHS